MLNYKGSFSMTKLFCLLMQTNVNRDYSFTSLPVIASSLLRITSCYIYVTCSRRKISLS